MANNFITTLKNFFRYTLEPTAIEFRSTRKALLKARQFVQSGPLLDVGCGDKPYESIFKELTTAYVGMDFPGAGNNSRKIDLFASGLAIPFRDAAFTTVTLIQVLEHTPDPKRLLSEVARVLTKGGVLIATVPFTYSIHSEPYDYFRYTSYGIRELFKDGFSIEILECKTYFFKTMAQMTCNHFWQNVKKQNNRLLYLLLGIPSMVVVTLVQCAGIVLELFSKDDKLTTGYLVVAKAVKD